MARLKSRSFALSYERDCTDIDHTIVWVRGDHDMATTVPLAAIIAEAALVKGAAIVLDLSGVTFMDASTLGVIVGSANRLRPQALELRAPSPSALRVLELCGLTKLIHTATASASPHPLVAAALGTWVEVPSTETGGEAIDCGADEVVAPRLVDAAVMVEADRGGP